MRRKIREEEETGELNIVTYLDIVVNLVMFMLLSMAGLLSFGVLDVATPSIAEGAVAQQPPDQANKEPELLLTVGISEKGHYIAGTGGVIEADANPAATAGLDTSRPPTIPKRGSDYDYSALTDKLELIKEKFPNEKKVILVADMNIPYDVVISTMDACREKILPPGTEGVREHKSLFPEVWLSAMQ